MTTELFCNLKQSLALKELGFKENCFGYYADKTGEDNTIYTVSQVQGSIDSMSVHFNNDLFPSYMFSAPLKQQAFKFFREKYKLDCVVAPSGDINLKTMGYYYEILMGKNTSNIESEDFKTYEEAEDECLNRLIEIAKETKQHTL